MFTAEQGKLLNRECASALSSAIRKVHAKGPDLYSQFLMSNASVALKYLQHIHHIAIEGFPPIAVSVFRTYYEIVCSNMYLAEHRDEFQDFLNFGRRMYYEIGESQKLSGRLLRQLVPDHHQLREYFLSKKKQRGGQQLSWHGLTIERLGEAVGMERFADRQLVRSQYTKSSKLVHGDSLLTLLAYNLDQFGPQPMPFAPPMETFRVDAVGATCGMFIALLASVDVTMGGLFCGEIEALNGVFQQVWLEATGVNLNDFVKTSESAPSRGRPKLSDS